MFDDDVDDEEGCWWRNWRLKLSCENFVDCLVLRIFSSGRSRNFLCCRGEFVALLVRMMMMMGDAGGSAVEGSEVVCLLDRDCASQKCCVLPC